MPPRDKRQECLLLNRLWRQRTRSAMPLQPFSGAAVAATRHQQRDLLMGRFVAEREEVKFYPQ